jgi:hypothetical protein
MRRPAEVIFVRLARTATVGRAVTNLVEPTARAPACSRERAKAWIKRPAAMWVPADRKYFSLVLVPKLSDCETEKKSNLRVRNRAEQNSIDELSLRRNIAEGRPLTVRQLSLAGASASRGGPRLLVLHRIAECLETEEW